MRAGIDRSANGQAEAGYEVVDAEPPQIAEATKAWFDVIGADFAGVWPSCGKPPRPLPSRWSVAPWRLACSSHFLTSAIAVLGS